MDSGSSDSAVAQLAAEYPQMPVPLLSSILAATKNNVAQAIAMLNQMMTSVPPATTSAASSSSASSGKKTTTKAAAAASARSAVSSLPPNTSTCEIYGSGAQTCGYCHSAPRKTTTNFGIVAPRLTCDDYQSLIDIGWRRSGDYLYKQNNSTSCCPHYTIRLNVAKYKMNKQQKKCMKKFDAFLKGEHVEKKSDEDEGMDESNSSSAAASIVSPAVNQKASTTASTASSIPVDPHAESVCVQLLTTIEKLTQDGTLPKIAPDSYTKTLRVYAFVPHVPKAKKEKAAKGMSDAASSTVAPTQNADVKIESASSSSPATSAQPTTPWTYTTNAALLLSGAIKKLPSATPLTPSAVAALLVQHSSGFKSEATEQGYINIHVDGVEPPSLVAEKEKKGSQKKKKQPFEKKIVSDSTPAAADASSSSSSNAPALTPHTFSIVQVPATFNAEAFAVYKKYQKEVHKDKEEKLTKDQYTNFLCNSPLIANSIYGGFHQHYILDGKIIGVGVVDILPDCLSSVYLYYDPDYEFLNLGTVTAVKEIEWVQERNKTFKDLKYYYMGYYIHTCRKMRYKAAFAPSELLCPFRGTWHSFSQVKAALDSVASRKNADGSENKTPPNVVILSDVAEEVREEDGSRPRYRSPTFVIRKDENNGGANVSTVATTGGATGEKKKKKKKKKKSKSSTAAAAAASSSPNAKPESDDDEEEDETAAESKMNDVPASTIAVVPSSTVVATSSRPQLAVASSSSSAASSSTQSAAFSTTTAASSSSIFSYPLIDATHPYIYSNVSAASSSSHRMDLAQSVEDFIPISIHKRGPILFANLDQYIKGQIRRIIHEYAIAVGPQLAPKMVVMFN